MNNASVEKLLETTKALSHADFLAWLTVWLARPLDLEEKL